MQIESNCNVMSVDAKNDAAKDLVCLLPESYDPSVKEVQMGLDESGVSLMREACYANNLLR